jgi:hypothetical protein
MKINSFYKWTIVKKKKSGVGVLSGANENDVVTRWNYDTFTQGQQHSDPVGVVSTTLTCNS